MNFGDYTQSEGFLSRNEHSWSFSFEIFSNHIVIQNYPELLFRKGKRTIIFFRIKMQTLG